MKFLFLFFLFINPINSFAAITINSVNGASNYDIIVNNSNSSEELAPIIYGGLAGSDCSGSGTTTSTCNSCALATNPSGDMSCNESRVFGDLKLTIYYKSDSASGFPLASTGDADNTTITPTERSSSTSQGAQVFASFNWDVICNAVAGANCQAITGSHYKILRVGIDADNDGILTSSEDYVSIKFIVSKPAVGNITDCNNPSGVTGVCGLVVFPGDQKVYIDALGWTQIPPNLAVDPSIGIFKFNQVKIMYGESANEAIPSGTSTNLNLLDNGMSVTPNIVDGLTNGTTYHFRFGSVDAAGNLSNVSTGTQTAEPSQTAGLLAEDINCFIATAAFGSTLDPRIESLRSFRNLYLLNSDFGKYLVKIYYNFSPQLAEKIHGSALLKTLAQAFVWPAVLWAEACLKYGFLRVNALLLFLLLTMASSFVFILRRQKC